eukprot:tig00021254_g19720.t1
MSDTEDVPAASPEVEETPAAEAEAPAETPADAEAAADGEAPKAPKLVIPAQRVKRFPQPNREQFEKQLAAINESMDECRKKLAEIKEQLDSREGNKGQFHDAESAELEKLKALQKVTRELNNERNAIRAELDALKSQPTGAAAGGAAPVAPAPRAKPAFTSLEDINKQIRELEFQLATSTLSLKEEKQVLSDIKALQAAREAASGRDVAVASVADSSQNPAQKAKADRQAVFDRLKAKEDEIRRAREAEDAQRTVFENMRANRAASNSSVPTLIATRKILRDHMNELFQHSKQMRDDYFKRLQEWRINEKIWYEQTKHEREASRQARMQERKQRDDEREARRAEYMRRNPYEADLEMVDVIIAYLKPLNPNAEAAAPEPAAAAASSAPIAGTKDAKGFWRKRDDEEDLGGLFGGLGKKKKGAEKKPAAPAAKKPERLIHSVEKIAAFDKFKVKPPFMNTDVPAAIEALLAKKETMKKKEEEWKRRLEAGEPLPPVEDEQEPVVVKTATEKPAKPTKVPDTVKLDEFPSLGAAHKKGGAASSSAAAAPAPAPAAEAAAAAAEEEGDVDAKYERLVAEADKFAAEAAKAAEEEAKAAAAEAAAEEAAAAGKAEEELEEGEIREEKPKKEEKKKDKGGKKEKEAAKKEEAAPAGEGKVSLKVSAGENGEAKVSLSFKTDA